MRTQVLGLVICCVLMFLLMQPAFARDTITLEFASYFPTAANQSKLLEQFCKEVKEKTQNKVKIYFHGGGALLKATKVYDGVVQGIADIGFSHIEYTRGRFPVTELLDLPLGYPSAWVGAHVANDFYTTFQPEEWADCHVLWFSTSPPNAIITKDTPVHTLDDLQHLTLRGPGVVGEIVKALGATPKPVPLVEAYDAISRGVIDGSMTPIETLFSFRLAETVKYVTNCWKATDFYTFYVVMNKNTWNKLPKKIQETIDTLSQEYINKSATVWNEVDVRGYKKGKNEGVTFINLSPKEMARWEQAVEPVIGQKVDQLIQAGHDKDKILRQIEYIEKRIQYWTQKQSEENIKSPTGPQEIIMH